MKTTIISALCTAFMIFGTVAMSTLTSCERRQSVGEKIDDALDNRPAEGLRDAAEDTKDSVKDAAQETKDAVKDATN